MRSSSLWADHQTFPRYITSSKLSRASSRDGDEEVLGWRRMSLRVSFENSHSNGVDFFTAMQGESSETVVAAVVRMWEKFKSIPASLGGVVLKSTDENTVAIYQMWVKHADLGEYHELLSSDLEDVEAVADINANFFEAVAAEGKQQGVEYVVEKGGVYGIQVFALELAEKWEGILSAGQHVMKQLLSSVEALEWYIILRSWDNSKIMLLTKLASPEQHQELVFGPVELGLKDVGIIKEVENVFRVLES